MELPSLYFIFKFSSDRDASGAGETFKIDGILKKKDIYIFIIILELIQYNNIKKLNIYIFYINFNIYINIFLFFKFIYIYIFFNYININLYLPILLIFFLNY